MRSEEAHLVPLMDARAARAADRFTIEELGVDGLILMEHAGRAVAEHALRMRGNGTILVVCGPGNNGGDGFVAARHILSRGIPVIVAVTREPTHGTGDALRAAELFLRLASARDARAPSGRDLVRVTTDGDALARVIGDERPSLVVDALFGTGLSRPLVGEAATIVDAMSRAACPILSVDVPSGLPTDGEAPRGACVVATETVTFHARKIAHVSEPGCAYVGKVHVVDIGVSESPNAAPPSTLLVASLARADEDVLAARAGALAHKGRHGHVGVALGSPPTEGAALLAAHAALRAGAGLVSLVGKTRVLAEPELMQRIGDDDSVLIDGIDALVVGPGFGTSDEAHARVRALATSAAARRAALVVDADALRPVLDLELDVPQVCTPHPGEAARLLGSSTDDIQQDRVGAVRALAERFRSTKRAFILKGACPLVHARGGPVVVVEGGTPALAVAGSGDVLAGIVGALLASGADPVDAARRAAFWHQAAGRALAERAPRGHLAHEIADALPRARARMTSRAST